MTRAKIVILSKANDLFFTLAAAAILVTACSDAPPRQKIAQFVQRTAEQPDEVPKVINAELPFHYPLAMYARRAQGNVTLRLFVDRDGLPTADSTRIEESSGHPALDSAALRGATELRFVPAKLRGEPFPIAVLFPVYFRHPEARALPGDSIFTPRSHVP